MKLYTLPDGSTIEVDTKSRPRGYLLVARSRTVRTGKTAGKPKRTRPLWYPSVDQLLNDWANRRPLGLAGTLPEALMQAAEELRRAKLEAPAALSSAPEVARIGQRNGRQLATKKAA